MIYSLWRGHITRAGLYCVFFILVMQIQSSSQIGVAASGQAGIMRQSESMIQGPFVEQSANPFVYDGDLKDLPLDEGTQAEILQVPLKYVPGTEPKGASTTIANWHDTVAQTVPGIGLMPSPMKNFPGMSMSAGGAGWPPDTNGDVGPEHYIQTVNTSIAIYDKDTGAELFRRTFNQFFQAGGAASPCNSANYGDPVVVYDRLADRWIISDFAIPRPFYECIAVSKTGDPILGGWYFYTVKISDTSVNDYPKLGAWPDAYYFSFNMFLNSSYWDGVQVWAFDRNDMLAGRAVDIVHFTLGAGTGYGSLMPSHLLSAPPEGSPNYFASVAPPDDFQLWEFHVDWGTPANSTFTGPTNLDVADFAIAASVPQRDSSSLLDSLSFRPMMQLQYRKIGSVESLWLNHTVASQGVAAVRWYEVRDPGGTPNLFQQGTYQPDLDHRWMGSLAVDRDGNMALGYSVSNSDMYPAIRYVGRLAGEPPGVLNQAEAPLIEGTGSQTTYTRWGDYSAMSVDPVDDCTFWYTQEYYMTTGINWQTRIGSLKFPTCGQPKGFLIGIVRNSITGVPVPGVTVVATTPGLVFSTLTDGTGHYSFTLVAGTYTLTAGPLKPGYPDATTFGNVNIIINQTRAKDIDLVPKPFMEEDVLVVDDSGTHGNDNGFPEPGEQGLLLLEDLHNIGATTATNVVADLYSLTPGLTINKSSSGYPDIAVGGTQPNATPFMFSLSPNLVCGSDVNFRKVIHSTQGSQTLDFSLNLSVLGARTNFFFDDVESGTGVWTTGGTLDTCGITTSDSHSPTHSWTDSPGNGVNYKDNTNSYIKTNAFDLSGKRGVEVSGWFKYALEAGYDYVYLEYSLDGGSTWNTQNPLMVFNGHLDIWQQTTVDASVLDNQPNVALRFHLVTDPGVVYDGIYIDDISISYEPYDCPYITADIPGRPSLLFPQEGGFDFTPVLFLWEEGQGGSPAEGYILKVDDSPLVTFNTPVNTTTQNISPGPHTWSVIATNSAGQSLESDEWAFMALPMATGVPEAPTLVSPADQSETQSEYVFFRWIGATSGGTPLGYIFTLDGVDVVTTTNRANWLVLHLTPGVHTWRVRAYNGDGQSTPSATWAVVIPNIQNIPTIFRW